ncbi:MAG: HxsD-like protein [Myxococcota bacterium]
MHSSSSREFSHSLYNPASIDDTQSAYEGLLPAVVSHGPHSTTVDFNMDDNEEGKMLVDAFCNHALFLTIERFRGQSAS